MKIKRYLSFDETRLSWVLVANKIFHTRVARKWHIDEGLAFYNLFLQYLDIDTRTKEKELLFSLKRMIWAAKKHAVKFICIAIDKDIKTQLSV